MFAKLGKEAKKAKKKQDKLARGGSAALGDVQGARPIY